MSEKVSKVIIWMTCYNHEKYVKEAVDSVIGQTYGNWELYVANDGSTDRSGEILAAYQDERIHFYNFNENTKLVGVTNFLLEICEEVEADYIACIASDDMWHKDKLKKQVEFLSKHPEFKACFTWDKIIFSSQNKGLYENNLLYSHKENKNRFEWINYFFWRGNCLNACSMLMDKQIFYELDQMNQNYFQFADFRLWMKLIEKHPFYLLNEELTYYRRHDSNLSEPSKEVSVRCLNEQYQTVKEIIVPMEKETFHKAFYRNLPYISLDTEEDLLAEKFILLVNSISPEKEQAAIDIYFANCRNKEFISILETKYYFHTQDFFNLSGKGGMPTGFNPHFRDGRTLYTPALILINAIDAQKFNADNFSTFRYSTLFDLWDYTQQYEGGRHNFETVKQIIMDLQDKSAALKKKKKTLFIVAEHSAWNFSERIPCGQNEDNPYIAFVPSKEDGMEYNRCLQETSVEGAEIISLYNINEHSLYFLNELLIEVDRICYVDCLDSRYECGNMIAGYSLAVEHSCILEERLYQNMLQSEEKILAMMKNISLYSSEV